MYSQERFDDILSLKQTLKKPNKSDIIDAIHADTVASYFQSNRLKSQTLSERMELINETGLSRKKIQEGCLKQYDSLKKHNIIEEL